MGGASAGRAESRGGDWRDRVPPRLREMVRRRVAIDARALGAFRLCLGLLLLVDLFVRAQDLRAHYTDAGILPRVTAIEFVDPLSIHMLVGNVEGIAVLFAVQAIVAVAFAVGYRTRLTAILTFVLWLSLHNRTLVVLNGGDTLLRAMLFWAIFVPLGTRFSVDALQSADDASRSIATLGTFALLFQVVVMYTANAILKETGTIWLAGDGLAYAMSVEQFTTPFGDLLRSFPTVMTVLSFLVVGLWFSSPLLLVLTGRLRGLLATGFIGAHLSMALTMHLGLFPFVVVVSFFLFFPSPVWDRLERIVDHVVERLGREHLRSETARWYLSVEPGDGLQRLRHGLRYAVVVVLVVSLLFVSVWNVELVREEDDIVPEPLDTYGETVGLTQYWTMFAPDPLAVDGWWVMPGHLTNGTRIDVYRGGPVSYEKPADVSAQYPTQRWRKYMMNLRRDGYREYRRHYAAYRCRDWNRTHDVGLRNITMIFVREETGLPTDELPEPRTVLEYECASDDAGSYS